MSQYLEIGREDFNPGLWISSLSSVVLSSMGIYSHKAFWSAKKAQMFLKS